MKVRRAVPGEGAAVAGLIRDSLPPQLRPLTIWHSPKVNRYVEQVLALPSEAATSTYYLLLNDRNETTGVVEFRGTGPHAFLNYIAVSPDCRGRSYGRLLLRGAAADFLAERRVESVSLDADPTNSVAYRWYRRLGFVDLGEVFWQLGHILENAADAGMILDRKGAEAMHGAFGFSRLRIKTKMHTHEVGRLGRDYFRIDELAWSDPGVHAALRRLDAGRRLLLLASDPRRHLTTVHHSLRLATEANGLRERLRETRAMATLSGSVWPMRS